MEKFETDVAIIGAGPVGLFAAFEAGVLGMKTILIDSLPDVGGQCMALYPTKPIYDIPGYKIITAEDLISNLQEQAKQFEPSYILGAQVVSFDQQDEVFILKTSKNHKIFSKAVIIAAGCGSFGPNKPPLLGIEEFEGKNVLYSINNYKSFKNKKIVIAGGGDSAADWAIILADIASQVDLVHRRNKFSCANNSAQKLLELDKEGKINLQIPFQLSKISQAENNQIEVSIIDLDGNERRIIADHLFPFFGLSMELGPILEWGLAIDKKHINVDQSTMQTNIPGVYAIGDVANYPGKLKLILTGFSEAALACHSAFKNVFPGKALHFEYSTSNQKFTN